MSNLIPVDRIYESARVIAFYHPNPSYKIHILILPKRKIRSLMDISKEERDILWEITLAAQEIVRHLGLDKKGYRLINNGGTYQDIEMLHFHLISD